MFPWSEAQIHSYWTEKPSLFYGGEMTFYLIFLAWSFFEVDFEVLFVDNTYLLQNYK